ncbi:MAG TPA: glycosyltransferase family 39 protein [Chloroflexia bacterium]|nr:glycosyltransferase family 39 protein [Chloroflexia bacterium]
MRDARAAPPPGPRPPARRVWTRTDSLLCAGLAAAAVLVRLPELLTLPAFRDELAEVFLGVQIARGTALPLTNVTADIGPLYNYLLALLFAATGPDLYLPRLFVTGLGAATVALTYALAWTLTGRRLLAALAAAFLATNALHILVGHLAWSNATTPFWTTATLLALAAAFRGGNATRAPRPRLLLAAAVLAALALQTHLTVVVLLAGLGAWLVWPAPGWGRRLRRPVLWGALGLFLLAYANMIGVNLVHPLAFWTAGIGTKTYALATAAGPPDYLANLGGLLLEWVRANGAVFAPDAALAPYLAEPRVWLYGALLAAGIGLAARGRRWLLLAPVLSTALLMPLFNRDYQFAIHTRYIGFLLPIGAILTALPLVGLWDRLRRPAETRRGTVAQLGWGLLAAGLVLAPLPALAGYYREELAAGRSNVGVIATLAALTPGQAGAVAYINTVDQAKSIGLGLDIWGTPHTALIDNNEPRLPPGAGGLDTPAAWRAFADWLGGLPAGTRDLAVVLPPAAVPAWRALGRPLPWSAPVLTRGSDGAPVVAILRVPLTVGQVRAYPALRLYTSVLLVVPRLADTQAPGLHSVLVAALAGGQMVRIVVLEASPDAAAEAAAAGALAAQGLPAGQILWAGYPERFLRQLPATGTWTDPATGATTTGSRPGGTLHEQVFAAPAPLSAAAVRADLRAAVVLYRPQTILAPPATSADLPAAVTGQAAAFVARKTAVALQVVP